DRAGHVQDAQRLTEKYGGNTQSWEDVSYWLLQESTQQYSADPVVKFGFCRGLEPVNYVSHILARFDRYKQFVARRHATEPSPWRTGGSRGIGPTVTAGRYRTASSSERDKDVTYASGLNSPSARFSRELSPYPGRYRSRFCNNAVL